MFLLLLGRGRTFQGLQIISNGIFRLSRENFAELLMNLLGTNNSCLLLKGANCIHSRRKKPLKNFLVKFLWEI